MATDKNVKLKLLLIIIVVAIIITIGAVMVKGLTNPTPKILTTEEMEEVLKSIESSYWYIDSGSKKIKLKELSYSPIKEISFDRCNDKKALPIILTTDKLGFNGFVVKGEEGLKLRVDNSVLDIWYSESKDKHSKTITINGKENYLIFEKE